jgi:hypothetical protein
MVWKLLSGPNSGAHHQISFDSQALEAEDEDARQKSALELSGN